MANETTSSSALSLAISHEIGATIPARKMLTRAIRWAARLLKRFMPKDATGFSPYHAIAIAASNTGVGFMPEQALGC
jgi:hypothetical protein